jgi:heat induced stress protein YflT
MTQVNSNENSVVAVYPHHSDAENAIKLLEKGDFNIKKLAIVGQGYHTEDQVVGYYTTGDRVKHWGKNGAFWGGLWGMLVGSAFFLIPGVGPVMVAGSAVAWIVGALESAVVVGGLSALGAGLYCIGVPKDTALKYESSVKAGKFLLIAHGTPIEADLARRILANTEAEEINVHEAEQPAAAA